MEKPDCDPKKPSDEDEGGNSDISPKNKMRSRGKKRKRRDSSNSSTHSEEVLPENAFEVEKNVIASAVKNNLDDVSVKKILKKVVTNDHVLALVKLREEEEKSSTEDSKLQPKLTRAKVKELMKVSPKTAPWNLENLELTPIKHIPVKTRPEVKALIAQELPEDEDDEEYEPTNDDVPSDDDQGLESCSDLDSQPRTPATPRSQSKSSPVVVKDGPFKVPPDVPVAARRKLNLEEEATIALRTRSKLCLSETPIEHIESSFVPPDDLPVPVVDDHLWNEFLNECLNPASVSKNEDDDETDPEYNVAADPDAPDEDDELEGSLIKISKKELNDLVTELFNIMPEESVDHELANISGVVDDFRTSNRWDGKQEAASDDETSVKMVDRIVFEKKSSSTKLSVGKMEIDDTTYHEYEDQSETAVVRENGDEVQAQPICIVIQQPPNVVSLCMEEQRPPQDISDVAPPPSVRGLQAPPAVHRMQVEVNDTNTILPEQILILQQQLRIHIQLAASNFLQLYVHPIHWSYGPSYKEYLETFSKMATANPKSVVNVCNLRPAMELVESWAETVSENTPENTELVEFIQKESDRCRRRHANNNPYIGDFHETLMRVVANSCVFVYPHLLPPMPYRPHHNRRCIYMPSEDSYIALGLEQFWNYVEANPEIYKRPPRPCGRKARWGLIYVVDLVVKHMMPWLSGSLLHNHLQQVRRTSERDNPIQVFFRTQQVTPVKHRLLAFDPSLTLYQQPEYEMPRRWLRYLAKTSKRFRLFLRRRAHASGTAPKGVDIDFENLNGVIPVVPSKTALPINYTEQVISTDAKPEFKDKFDIKINTLPMTPINDSIDGAHNASSLFKLVETSKGINLVPLDTVIEDSTPNIVIQPLKQNGCNTGMKLMTIEPLKMNSIETPQVRCLQTNTVDCNVTPISSAVENKKVLTENSSNIEKTQKEDPNHCKCCIIMRRFFKPKQKRITDYFRNKNERKEMCHCTNRSYPRITNRLKLLVNKFKRQSDCIYKDINQRLERLKGTGKSERQTDENHLDNSNVAEDLELVNSFQLTLLLRSAILAKHAQTKKRINSLFTKFDVDHDDPVVLARNLESLCDVELVDTFKEFLPFLTPEQADKLKKFRDYFVNTCAPGLVQKIEEHVTNKEKKFNILNQLSRLFAGPWAPCQMCGVLLLHMQGHPALAAYTFDLFPHRSSQK
ncbi:uncharacterized protein LOC114357508 isoform X3 [Ostrinia furnacalis]|uniref:uncharacterized protein LOC114357508 isoform X3 n=1 Tax=Ostrinia furnacalis TaxID=93504 RepID=UPI001038705F|nr:uncharacterized protein LOC114357508 isoform X3 [Ostrinia furnacalis]